MVESTLSETRQSREEIEVKRGLCQQFIRRSHPYDIIQKRDTVLDLKADISKQLPKCNLNTASLKSELPGKIISAENTRSLT